MTADDDVAIKIGDLYRKAAEGMPIPEVLPPLPKTGRDSVTPLRKFSGKLSGSRNGTMTRDGHGSHRSLDATVCHYCDEKFKPGQMRYPILDYRGGGWRPNGKFKSLTYEPVSVCLDCFKCASDDETGPQPAPRREEKCPGCGEPIFVSPSWRWRLKFCSIRCYQRIYRKRRRDEGSLISWKGSAARKCECCKKPLRGKRRDSKFCSNQCRQWQYRRRHAD